LSLFVIIRPLSQWGVTESKNAGQPA
jgi:hypothetical protein